LILTWAFDFNASMRADLRISVKDFRHRKTLKVQLSRVPFSRQFWVRMNGARWPDDGRPVSLSPGGGRFRAAAGCHVNRSVLEAGQRTGDLFRKAGARLFAKSAPRC
jgi:hypothetical protein